jgi:hypothetical protein
MVSISCFHLSLPVEYEKIGGKGFTMKKVFYFLTLLIPVIITLTGCQMFPPPKAILMSDYDSLRIKANGNSRDKIQEEIQSQKFAKSLAKRKGILEEKVNTFLSLLRFEKDGSIQISHVLDKNISDAIELYVEMRKAGHSMDYALERLQNEPDTGSLTVDGQLIFAYDKHICFSKLWIYSLNLEPEANLVTYVVLDRDLAFFYAIERTNTRILRSYNFSCVDSKEVLPEYRQIFAEVEAQVSREMKAEKVEVLGSTHEYWDRKKKLLKSRGIDWISPGDLHPSARYD